MLPASGPGGTARRPRSRHRHRGRVPFPARMPRPVSRAEGRHGDGQPVPRLPRVRGGGGWLFQGRCGGGPDALWGMGVRSGAAGRRPGHSGHGRGGQRGDLADHCRPFRAACGRHTRTARARAPGGSVSPELGGVVKARVHSYGAASSCAGSSNRRLARSPSSAMRFASGRRDASRSSGHPPSRARIRPKDSAAEASTSSSSTGELATSTSAFTTCSPEYASRSIAASSRSSIRAVLSSRTEINPVGCGTTTFPSSWNAATSIQRQAP